MTERSGILGWAGVLAAGALLLGFWLFRDSGTPSAASPARTAAFEAEQVPADGSERQRGVQRAPIAEPSERSEAVNGTGSEGGSVLVLDLASRKETVGSTWRLESAGLAIERHVDAHGRFSAPAGEWALYSVDEESWQPLERVIRIEASQTTVLWVTRAYSIKVKVIDSFGHPVVGALVRWLPTHTSSGDSDWDRPDGIEVRTGESGHAVLEGLAQAAGDLCVLADGFSGLRWELSGPFDRDLVLKLSPSAKQTRIVTLVNDFDTTPIPFVTMTSTLGPVPGQSDLQGRFELPTWLDDEHFVLLEGEQIVSAQARVKALLQQETVRLLLRSMVTLNAVSSESLGPSEVQDLWTCNVDTQGWPKDGVLAPVLQRSVQWSGFTSPRLTVARGKPTTLRFSRSSGLAGVLAIQPQAETESYTISASSAPSLNVAVSAANDTECTATLAAQYAQGMKSFERTVMCGTTIGVPFAERVRRLEIRAPGYAPVMLIPVEGVDHTGQLNVKLDPCMTLKVRVVDGRREPLQGMYVEFSESSVLRDREQVPPASGRWPTDHAGWVEIDAYTPSGTTGVRGEVLLQGLRYGEYVAWVSMDTISDGLRGRASFLSFPPQTVGVGGGNTEVELSVSSLKWHCFRVIDRYNGSLLRNLFISSPEGLPSQIVRVDDGYWEGWIPEEWRAIDVGALGYDRVRLERGELEAMSAHVVELDPSKGCTIEVHGEVDLLEGASVQGHIVQHVTGAKGSHWSGLGLTTATLNAGTLRFGSWPVDRDLRIELMPFEHAGQQWEFDPPILPLTSGVSRTNVRPQLPE